jgi:CRISPR-associated DxTHG motif protein
MTRKVITFLGIKPQDAVYEWRGKTYPAKVMAQAIREFVQFDQMLVFVTPGAMSGTFPILAELQDERIKPVEIVDGKDTESMWRIFQTVVEHVQEGETVIFDVTHGFRSLPFLAFLFIAYLKSAKNVKIESVYYGAFDMKKDGVTPVLDLSQFVTMLDWIAAADRFVDFGDSTKLADLANKAGRFKDTHPMKVATQKMNSLSQALRFIRPTDAMQISAELPQALDDARSVAEEIPALRPYLFLVDDLKNAYAPFAFSHVFEESHIEETLANQRDLINWYVKRQQWAQAVSLAREWLVTWVMWHLGETDFLDQPLRESIAQTISSEAQRRLNAKKQNKIFETILLRNIPHISAVLGDWLALTGVRNDIDHAGMRRSPKSSQELESSIVTLCKKINDLPLAKTH